MAKIRNFVVADALASWFPNGIDQVSDRLQGGDLNDVYRVDVDDRSYALRLYSEASNKETVRSEHSIVIPLAERILEVYPPITTTNGENLVEIHNRVATLSPFIHGKRPDRRNPKHRKAGAILLGRLHSEAKNLGLVRRHPRFPAVADIDWDNNHQWTWPSIMDYLANAPNSDVGGVDRGWMRAKLEEALAEIPAAVVKLATRANLARQQIHGDFYPGNMLSIGSRIVGLLDWEETIFEWRVWEVAQAIAGFCKLPENRMDQSAAIDFIGHYERYASPLTDKELGAIVPLISAGILWGTLYDFGEFQRSVNRRHGIPTDWPYHAAEIRLMNNLKEVRFR